MAQVTTGSGISKPVIRGLGYNRIVTIADGVRQEGQQWGDEHGIELDGASVGQVEILKGPASLMYGSDAMAGVVVFQPEAIEPAGSMSASVSTEYQTNSGLIDYSLRFGGNKKGFVWNGRFSDKYAHAYKNKYDNYVPGTQFGQRAANAMLGLNKEWGFTHLTLSFFHFTPSMTEGERDPLTGDLISPSSNLKTYRKALPYQQIHHYKAILDNSFALGGGLLKFTVGYQQNRRQEYEDEHEHEHEHEEGFPEEGEEHEHEHEHEHDHGDAPGLDLRLQTITYDARYSYNVFEGWKLTAGVGGMWQESQNLGEEFLIPDFRLFDIGAYATASKDLKHWTLSGGVRFDSRDLHSLSLLEDGRERFSDFKRKFSALTGSLGAVYHASRNVNLRANVARGFRAPNISELGASGIHHGTFRYEIGNHDLRPEHSIQADLGIDYSGRIISLEGALFINRIGNYIFAEAIPIYWVNDAPATSSAQPSASDGFPVGVQNLTNFLGSYRYYGFTQGDALLKGFEAGFDLHPIHQLHIGSTFSMVDARQLHQPLESRYLPLTPPARLTGELKWEFIHNGDHHTAAPHHLRERHDQHHRIDHLFDNTFVSIDVEHYFKQDHYFRAYDTETATPAYTLFGITAGTDILLRSGSKLCELYFIADNLLDCAYQSHLSRLKYAEVNNVTGRRGIFNPGRNFTVKLLFPIRL